MKLPASPILGLLLSLASSSISHAVDKTSVPVIIDPAVLNDDPYRFNGIVLMPKSRGSGFCSWNSKTFFTAAHVVYDTEQKDKTKTKWDVPPIWLPKVNGDTIDTPEIIDSAIQARGYYRWTQYATLRDKETQFNEYNGYKAFSRDGVLAFAFRDLISGPPAPLNLNGLRDLKTRRSTLITGYPGDNLYRDFLLEGYFLRQTGPFMTQYQSRGNGNDLETTLITTGHGNSGGPIWTQNRQSEWQAAGILVGGFLSSCRHSTY
jgi:V8-like Glu-specific endopeptidase